MSGVELVGLIRRMVPAAMVVEGAPVGEHGLLAAVYEGLVVGASPQRRQEFLAGRAAAHQALAGLGVATGLIGSGSDREPLWPDGVVGSITHCGADCIAAVARAADMAGVGIDVERVDAVTPEIVDLVARPVEQAWLRERPGERWGAAVVFSAKESVYKAWFPLTRRWLDFADVEVEVDEDRRLFRAHPAGGAAGERPELIERLEGRFEIAGDRVLAAVWLPPQSAWSESSSG